MTSGEIAKKTGVSQKTVRLYDEKGLLKPSGYSEGNYRLYDKSALAVLEKNYCLEANWIFLGGDSRQSGSGEGRGHYGCVDTAVKKFGGQKI